jgi:HSP20 family protein
MTPFAPLGELEALWKEFPLRPMTGGLEPEYLVRMDVTEDEKTYTVKAEMPGLKKDDISVSVDGNVVSITAEAKREKEEKKGEKVVRSERYYGAIARTFTLGSDIDLAKADATYENGVLTLTLPKAPGTEAKKLPVH